ncbi:MAG: Crp/Fnr family transcriptional regulator [Myxococcota bacterium]|jgi:CRP-like cAMP-binding protein|nr:Crp/Fnr family transcriptional regulator [Myxococcota bacterium]
MTQTDPLFAKYGRTAKAGELLFREGEQGAEMFVVRTGSVRVYVTSSSGVEKTLAVLGPGEFVGEMSLIIGKKRTASAVVNEDAEFVVVGGRILEEMIVHNTEIALRLIRKLARRLESADSLIQVLLHRDPRDRVIENLRRLAALHGFTPGEPLYLEADAEAMADQVGLTLSEVKDVISRLVRDGALAEQGGHWRIEDPNRLCDFLAALRARDQFR